MTLKQAFTLWSNAPRNIVLAARSRDAVQKVLMKKYSDIDLERITQTFAKRLFEQSPYAQELKTKAAAILVYLLQWGGDNGHCQRPNFDYTIANSEVIDPTPSHRDSLEFDSIDKPLLIIKPEAFEARKDIIVKKTENKDNEKTMKEEKRGGSRKAIEVAQIDPHTLKVVNVFPSRSMAEKTVGACNLDRAMRNRRLAAGFFWCQADEVDKFEPNPKSNIERFAGTGINSVENTPKENTEQSDGELHRLSDKLDITTVSNDDLIAEMKRRGWKGNVTMTINIEL